MLANAIPAYLLASSDPTLLASVEKLLLGNRARVDIFLSAETALPALTAAQVPTLALIDAELPGMEMGQLLAALHTGDEVRRFPIILLSDDLTREWADRMAEGVIDDVVPRSIEHSFLKMRMDAVLRSHHRLLELELLREAEARNNQLDPLTGVYNRATILSMLFRETDRVQRMKSSLSMILFDIDDFGHWNSRLGSEDCDELLCQVANRTAHLLRTYDLLGRAGKDEFLVALPGCGNVNAVMTAERLRMDVFSTPFRLGTEVIRLSACFGIASSLGRSPVVVLRDAEQALETAKANGPESIECSGECSQPSASPVAFLSSTSGDELLAW